MKQSAEQLRIMLALYGTDMSLFDMLCDQCERNLARVFTYMYKNDNITECCADWLEDNGYWTNHITIK